MCHKIYTDFLNVPLPILTYPDLPSPIIYPSPNCIHSHLSSFTLTYLHPSPILTYPHILAYTLIYPHLPSPNICMASSSLSMSLQREDRNSITCMVSTWLTPYTDEMQGIDQWCKCWNFQTIYKYVRIFIKTSMRKYICILIYIYLN